jgi:hypothetical protein
MGYTHYWSVVDPIDDVTWKQVCKDTRRLIAASPEPLAFESGAPSEPPLVNKKTIRFNAKGDRGHETLLLTPERKRFDFCKTAPQPYDLVVCAVLAAARDRSKAISVRSDGDSGDWAPALAWASEVLGRPIGDPVAREN